MTDNADRQPAERRCQWCDTPAQPTVTHCAACGAALPTEGADDLAVPGVTKLDPELEIYSRQPLRIPTGSPTQRIAGGAVGAAVAAGGPAGLLALGALAAVAANEYSSAAHSQREAQLDRLGQPSQPILDMARRLQQAQARGTPPPPPPPPPISPDAPASTGSSIGLPPPPPPAPAGAGPPDPPNT